ncbi:4-diphosphocytidyl-2-C-methyl-D-erythritol kinase [Acetobacter nitrogenifigens DSM 23921 = NBRC 105050]|uniref:4-diphosphocytidyl-2-C-methyl-D-erythritol kinase n=1 Tax=Acetobacter nitrogenifigens DSM 23921 = NBRC 105050 TaxID=1120919 RepID=A0A511XBR7_9PROT|nr:4-(cytidine 5'-diphospho)-2-C-methyl-D-erythritol kinase [Acetobacter nitrogenifigens]GBQ88440.1 4-diphosphocytidyl-2-C-methyl-D-erythritol kinase [Acetobacter nitrogenifigens DSM 23921 = NBRC 105050]GEN60404.1 4-diphosphocytidyl-2-C-methyl-D-erythritol kinase [Acetobacter nitrogenifigens DSM 23921 = NBRC 105050]
MILTETAHAKINLYLHVTGRRDDGYHLLDSLAVFAGAADTLFFSSDAAALSLSVEGPFGAELSTDATDDNLVMRAARLLAAEAGHTPTGSLTLEKTLPVASGIGGGSADAAAALRLLQQAWDVAVSEERLFELAEKLGADVPVCLAQRSARMGGVGERLDPAPALPDCGMILVNCGLGVSTPAVFRARDGGFSEAPALPAAWASAAEMATDLARLHNDLEAAACALCPTIRDVLSAINALPGCLLSRMSGSGATCFGIFDTPEAARRAAAQLSALTQARSWWVWAGGLAGRPKTSESRPAA